MLFRDLFKTIPNGNYITLEIYDGSIVHFIKGHKTHIDISTFYDYVVTEVRSTTNVGFDIEIFNRPLIKDIHGLRITTALG